MGIVLPNTFHSSGNCLERALDGSECACVLDVDGRFKEDCLRPGVCVGDKGWGLIVVNPITRLLLGGSYSSFISEDERRVIF